MKRKSHKSTSVPGKSGQSITRREMVQRVLGSAGAGLALPAVSVAHPGHAQTVVPAENAQAAAANWTPSYLDSHQNETVIVLAERLVPGSTSAQVNRFLDLALGAESQENQQKFLSALSAFEGEALRRFGHSFKDLTEAQQVGILTDASTPPKDHPEGPNAADWVAEAAKTPATPATVSLHDHFEFLKRSVVEAYYSSEIGMKELGWNGQHFFESFPGCEHPEGHN
jgi:hypothetical protein